MTREEFVSNYYKALDITAEGEPNPTTWVILSIIGSIYDQQQMIVYLDNRIIDLERIVYK